MPPTEGACSSGRSRPPVWTAGLGLEVVGVLQGKVHSSGVDLLAYLPYVRVPPTEWFANFPVLLAGGGVSTTACRADTIHDI